MALNIDKEKCISCMTCISMHPDLFKLDEDGKSIAITGIEASAEDTEAAISSCPVEAISAL